MDAACASDRAKNSPRPDSASPIGSEARDKTATQREDERQCLLAELKELMRASCASTRVAKRFPPDVATENLLQCDFTTRKREEKASVGSVNANIRSRRKAWGLPAIIAVVGLGGVSASLFFQSSTSELADLTFIDLTQHNDLDCQLVKTFRICRDLIPKRPNRRQAA